MHFAFLLVAALAAWQTWGPGSAEGVQAAAYWPVHAGWAGGFGGKDGSVQPGILRVLSSADLSLLKHENVSRGELLRASRSSPFEIQALAVLCRCSSMAAVGRRK